MDMLTSIPLPLHESAHNLWYPSTTSTAFTLTPSLPTTSTPSSAQAAQQQAAAVAAQTSSNRNTSRTSQRSFITHLRADEHAISLRRANIRRFGAGWLKPPGVAKTMQGLWDERAEKEEAELAALREAALAEAQALAEANANATTGGTGALGPGGELLGFDEEDDVDAGERDLDDDIPDADAGEEDGEGEGDETGDWDDDEDDDETDSNVLPMHEVDGDFGPDGAAARMDVIGDGAADMMSRDLDDDVPDAGSYQHTDTDVEDSSSLSDNDDDGNAAAAGGGGGGGARARNSMGMASVVGFAGLGSSPVPHAARRER